MSLPSPLDDDDEEDIEEEEEEGRQMDGRRKTRLRASAFHPSLSSSPSPQCLCSSSLDFQTL